VGRIAAGVAHEIRNPLSFINLSINYMRDKFALVAEVAREVCAFDLDEGMVELARRRLEGYVPERLQLRVGDAAAIEAGTVPSMRLLISASCTTSPTGGRRWLKSAACCIRASGSSLWK